MGQIDEYSHKVICEINEGYIKGGITKLKTEYPEAYESLEKELTDNFTIKGLDRYKERLTKGLKQVGHWKN